MDWNFKRKFDGDDFSILMLEKETVINIYIYIVVKEKEKIFINRGKKFLVNYKKTWRK
jgi:hypothetical protein